MSLVLEHHETATGRDIGWQAHVGRDASAGGSFVYAVKTTWIYGRPSCPWRAPKRGNDVVYDTIAAAEAAGYGAGHGCNPNGKSPAEVTADVIAEACRMIESAEEMAKLDERAYSVGFSPSHLHRQFEAVTGLTPRAYGAAQRAKRVRAKLADSKSSVTSAIYGTGFNSSSRFYEESNEVLAMTSSAFKKGGEGAEIRFAVGECSLGTILVAHSEKGICAISFGDDPQGLVHDLQDRFPSARLTGGDPDFEQLVARVVGFVEEPRTGLDLPLDMRGSAFQERVWQALREISPGETVTYAEISRRIGEPRAARAVGQACRANRIAVAIPCHRIVRNDGALCGYRWGVERKRALIEKETQE